jgi:hypothetical protein
VRPEELIVILTDLIEQHNHEFGFEYIVSGDGQLLPVYPACLVLYGGVARNLHGTHYFLTTLSTEVVIMHGDLRQNRMERTMADLELATKVVEMFHGEGLTLKDPRIHKSFVAQEEPATVSTENITAIGTALTVFAEVREAFK